MLTQNQIITALNNKLDHYRQAVSLELLTAAGYSSMKDYMFNAIINASPLGRVIIKDLASELKEEPANILRVLFSKP